jgi:hypothetical protein
MIFTYIAIGILIIIIIVIVVTNYYRNKTFVTSTFDNKQYLVNNLKYKILAANTLAKMKFKLSTLCIKLKQTYPDDERIDRLIAKFNPDNIVENEPDSSHTSYSINKGEKMVLCLRSRDGQHRIVKENIITFVALHELAHIMTLSVGHTQEFWDNFEFLLREAIKHGYYQDVDFTQTPYEYCGVKITDSPLRR